MSTRHTPGPWSFGSKGRFQQHIDGGPVGPKWFRLASVIVRLNGEDEDNTEGLANAQLIAAAPDLLEALDCEPLRELLGFLEDYGTPRGWALAQSFMAYRDSVVAKATGKEPA